MSVDLNSEVPHSARVYDYLLGGKDNFAADRSAAARILEASPGLPISMRANRTYMARAARFLAQQGVRQFLDIGAGLPTSPNLHNVVQQVDPTARVVYIDNDPIVSVHARALLTSTSEGRTAYLDGDVRNPEGLLASPEVLDTLDLSKPVGLCLIAILQFVTDEAEAHRIVDTLLTALAPGSALAISTVTAHNPQAVAAAARYTSGGIPAKPRTDDEVRALFRGLDLVEPGVVLVNRWRPDDEAAAAAEDVNVQMSGGVAFKP
ncbi:SAM-dependent methyltransferase [Cryptosporangium phraense]|uniref:SAM-dependent methyltransferase n=1 Tax=Cryptosporangium phraense TaxID=2593070 RepID=UPI00197AA0E3|nr:SAM-dependent methyltransferase [Cryptosporangium phraense]